MGSAFHQLCPRYSRTLTPTAPTAIKLCETFTFAFTFTALQRGISFESTLRLDFTVKLVRGLSFGTPKFYIAPYGKINHGLVKLS